MGSIPQATGIRNMERIVQGTVVNSTSGTSIDFTGIPSWVKKIKVLFNGVSTNGTSIIQIQLGSTTIETTGYASQAWSATVSTGVATTGLYTIAGTVAAFVVTGIIDILLQGSNTWISTGITNLTNASNVGSQSIGSKTLSGVLDRIRITTVNGTDTFDAGQINIMYEG